MFRSPFSLFYPPSPTLFLSHPLHVRRPFSVSSRLSLSPTSRLLFFALRENRNEYYPAVWPSECARELSVNVDHASSRATSTLSLVCHPRCTPLSVPIYPRFWPLFLVRGTWPANSCDVYGYHVPRPSDGNDPVSSYMFPLDTGY